MSTKATTQPGRRTPLSLTASASKAQSNKGGSNAANNNGTNANGHSTTNNSKQDNKLQQQKTDQKSNNSDIKESGNNKKGQQQQQSDKKQQTTQQQHQQEQQLQQADGNKKSIEKNQNGVSGVKQQNGNNKSNENDKKEKHEKQQDKSEKLEAKSKDHKKAESEIQENNNKDKKKIKEIKDTKEENMVEKNDAVNKDTEKTQYELAEKVDDKKSKLEKDTEKEVGNQKLEDEKIKEIEITEEQQKSPPSTPKTNRTNKTLTPINKTPTEKTPQKATTLNSAINTTPITKREVTTTIDDVEMEPLSVESSPIKTREPKEVAHINITPSATSTPGKIVFPKRSAAAPKSDVQLAMQSGYSLERPRVFSQISGRKSIRPITDYTPSKFQSNSQFRESYRRINTELDVTNTSMNVTVGSEVPNNLSFSFFYRGRKRDRTSPQHSQSAIGELHADMEVSPPKKARFDGFFSVVSSPLTLLRNRFSKTTLQSSTPLKLEEKFNASTDDIEVQNVSGVSIHEDLTTNEKETQSDTTSNKVTALDKEVKEAKSNSAIAEDKSVFIKNENSCGLEKTSEQSDIKITETPLQVAVGDPLAKNKRCIVM